MMPVDPHDPFPFNGEDPPVPPSWRSFFARIDTRSLQSIEAVGKLTAEVSQARSEIAALRVDIVRLTEIIATLRIKMRQSKRDADQSGEHTAQELINVHAALEQAKGELQALREQLVEKERVELARKLAEAEAREKESKAKESIRAAETSKRTRDRLWDVAKILITVVVTLVVGHLAWR